MCIYVDICIHIFIHICTHKYIPPVVIVCIGLLEVHHQPLKIFNSFFSDSCPQLGQTSSCDNYDNSCFPRVAQPQKKSGKQKMERHKLEIKRAGKFGLRRCKSTENNK